MAAATSVLAAAGVPRSRVHVEVYTSLSGDPFAGPAAMPEETGAAGEAGAGAVAAGETVPVEVELGGQTHAFDWPVTAPLADFLLAQGLDVPYSCRDGECGSCQATLVKGHVTMIRNEVLGEDDVAEGYILACQSVPDPASPGPVKVEFF